MLIKQILKQSEEQGTHAIQVEDFSSLQLCEKTEKSKAKRFDSEIKIFKLFLRFSYMTQYTVSF